MRKVRFITALAPSQPSRSSRSVSGEQRGGVGHGVEAPDQERVVVGDEAERAEAGGLHAAGQQQAEGLVGVAAGEAVEAEVGERGRAGKSRRAGGRGGQAADLGLERQPVAGVLGQEVQASGVASSSMTRCESSVEVASLAMITATLGEVAGRRVTSTGHLAGP